jgi:hypothetical protein
MKTTKTYRVVCGRMEDSTVYLTREEAEEDAVQLDLLFSSLCSPHIVIEVKR